MDYRKSSVALCFKDEHEHIEFTIEYEHTTTGKAKFVLDFLKVLRVYEPVCLTIEHPIITGKHFTSDRIMFNVFHMITLALGLYQLHTGDAVLLNDILPSVWKKAILGNGRADKAASKAYTGMSDDNIADAMIMAEYGLIELQKIALADGDVLSFEQIKQQEEA